MLGVGGPARHILCAMVERHHTKPRGAHSSADNPVTFENLDIESRTAQHAGARQPRQTSAYYSYAMRHGTSVSSTT